MVKNRSAKKQGERATFQLQLDLQNDHQISMTSIEFEAVILTALEGLHGQIGASIDFSIDDYQDGVAVVSLENCNITKFWSALTLFGQYQSMICAFRTVKVS